MIRFTFVLALLSVLGLPTRNALGAAEGTSAIPYSGGIWTRSTLTGDWGGLRNKLAAKGVTLDFDITQVGQGVAGAGKAALGSMADGPTSS